MQPQIFRAAVCYFNQTNSHKRITCVCNSSTFFLHFLRTKSDPFRPLLDRRGWVMYFPPKELSPLCKESMSQSHPPRPHSFQKTFRSYPTAALGDLARMGSSLGFNGENNQKKKKEKKKRKKERKKERKKKNNKQMSKKNVKKRREKS